jgi:UPF0716 protein FxsA
LIAKNKPAVLFYLILVFTAIPIIELALLLRIGERIGTVNTIAVVIITGILGAYLARSQGLMVVKKIKQDISLGIMPGDKLLEGALIFVGGIVLLTPGFLTDFAGFLLLIPFTRNLIKQRLKSRIRARIQWR